MAEAAGLPLGGKGNDESGDAGKDVLLGGKGNELSQRRPYFETDIFIFALGGGNDTALRIQMGIHKLHFLAGGDCHFYAASDTATILSSPTAAGSPC